MVGKPFIIPGAVIALEQIIKEAFVVAFRVVMLTASVLALVSALIASLTIPASAGKIVVAQVGVIGNESVKTAV